MVWKWCGGCDRQLSNLSSHLTQKSGRRDEKGLQVASAALTHASMHRVRGISVSPIGSTGYNSLEMKFFKVERQHDILEKTCIM